MAKHGKQGEGGARRRGAWALAGVVLALGGAPGALASGTAGTLDPAFGTDGLAQAADGTFTWARDMVVLSSGSVVEGAARDFAVGSEMWRDWTFRAWTAGGASDTAFGTGGVVHLFGGSGRDLLNDVAVDARDRILGCGDVGVTTTVVSGKKTQTTTSLVGMVVRLTSAGALDSTFGSGGKVSLSVPDTARCNGRSVAPLPDGRILVVGTCWVDVTKRGTTLSTPSTFLALLESNGALVGTFGSGGYVVDARGAAIPQAGALAVDAATGTLYVGHQKGYDATKQPSGEQWAVTRYVLATGGADTAFGTAGTLVSSGDVVRAVALDATGHLVASGNRSVSGGTAVRVARYDATTGEADTTFGTGGATLVTTFPSQGTSGSLVLDASGDLLLPVIVRLTAGSSDSVATVLRLAPTGALDSTFDGDGFGQPVAQTNRNETASVALASDGGILLSGRIFRANSPPPNDSWLFLARYASN